jgi:hypothetical protein
MERMEVALTRQTGAADLYDAATLTSTSSTSSCTADLLRRQAADLRSFINDLLDGSSQLQLESTTTTFRPRLHAQAKCYFQLNIFTASINFVDLLTCFSALPIPPPRYARGLAMPTHRSPVRGIQFLSCAMFPSHSTCSGACPCQSKGHQTCGVLPLPCVFFL